MIQNNGSVSWKTVVEIMADEQKKKKENKQDSLRDLW